ncbi:SusC/RagA family TonB-linked outer membrane protein [Chryseobacterium joostei]|uniref:SusC/RagA family TonB-linked outer membrane protein n=1 Tax=Chryseobacterium joostei TaxID=112234 RepID=A0A1N7IA62_9FLAO|nr:MULTISPECIES: SusC/RagA family TonB-linked outer membrane protein [Chryseobacterium]AZB01098.1 SusC/RagA family TonB-linked outer membrane protein [Chryseobacterium joostei]SIS33892.1 TonB-linked outer membrane protein, SusC/RagA family [Chryseobacterium joostei]HCM35242.1 SusC/RagA family TonB-linked outer membrane protein [Chryseobacterium sp.]
MNVKLRVLSAGVLFFMGGQTLLAQKKANDTIPEKTKEIDEVVVVAFGTQKKQSIAGSVAKIDAKELANVQSSNMITSLSGKVGGVQITTNSGQPGDPPQVRFRGLGSLSSSNNPLYVVDGMPFNGNISALNNNDIESITFLKDASANALYGSRGANGVVMITTKKGKKGKMNVTFDTKFGVNSRAVKEYDLITDPGEFYQVYFERLRITNMAQGMNYADASAAAAADLIDGDEGLRYNAYNVPGDQLIDPVTGKLNPNAKLLYQDDWQKEMFKPNTRQEYNVSIQAGSDKLNTYFSMGYLNDQGFLLNSGFKRFTGRSKVDYQITDKLKLSTSFNYTRADQVAPNSQSGNSQYSNLIGWGRNIAPIYPIWARNADGSLKYTREGDVMYDFGHPGNVNGMGLMRPYGGGLNAYAKAQLDQIRNIEDNINGRASLSWDFFDGFNFTYNFGIDILNGNYSGYGNPLGGDYVGYNGQVRSSTSFEQTFNNQQLLSWKKNFGKHNLDIMIGHENNDYTAKMLSGTRTNLVIPGLNNVSNGSRFSDLNGYNDYYNVEGFLSRVNYGYDNKYFVNASFRRDGSSVFSPENRWGNFFGLGGAWMVSNEDFLKGNKAITSLKLKASYGEQGNDALFYPSSVNINHRSYFGYARNYKAYQSQWENIPDASGNISIVQVYVGNEDIKWETSKNFNTGFELELFNRVNIDVEYFQRKVQDLLFNFPLQLSTGTGFQTRNIGDMQNTGVELNISADIIKGEDFNWSVFGNGTYYKNKVTYLPNSFTSGLFKFDEGKEAYTYYMRKFAGVNAANGNGIWYVDTFDASGNVTGQTTTENYAAATLYSLDKSANPKYYGGFGTKVGYKGINLSVNFGYQFGGYMYDATYAGMLQSRSSGDVTNFHKDIYNTWTPNNTNASMPAVDRQRQNNMATSDLFLIKSDYISLEDASITYDLSKNLLPEGISGVTFGVFGTNLALWSKRKGMDPRLTNLGSSLATNGTSMNKYGAQRTISFGLTVKF